MDIESDEDLTSVGLFLAESDEKFVCADRIIRDIDLYMVKKVNPSSILYRNNYVNRYLQKIDGLKDNNEIVKGAQKRLDADLFKEIKVYYYEIYKNFKLHISKKGKVYKKKVNPKIINGWTIYANCKTYESIESEFNSQKVILKSLYETEFSDISDWFAYFDKYNTLIDTLVAVRDSINKGNNIRLQYMQKTTLICLAAVAAMGAVATIGSFVL